MAIGELMTLKEEQGQLYCMGFAAFAHKYNNDPEFKKWFQSRRALHCLWMHVHVVILWQLIGCADYSTC
jgi:hypothetical protein